MRWLLLSLMLVGCAAPSGDYCQLYTPVYTHQADTEGTKVQVDANNVVWMRLCDER